MRRSHRPTCRPTNNQITRQPTNQSPSRPIHISRTPKRFSHGIPVHNEAQVAADIYAFLVKLLRRYPRFRGLPLYVFGESCT